MHHFYYVLLLRKIPNVCISNLITVIKNAFILMKTWLEYNVYFLSYLHFNHLLYRYYHFQCLSDYTNQKMAIITCVYINSSDAPHKADDYAITSQVKQKATCTSVIMKTTLF